MNVKRSVRLTVLSLALATMIGCYGPFNLTRRLHSWNGQIGGEWVNEGVFVGLVILPAYFFASLGDAIIFNSVEFWSGENPIDPPGAGGATASKTFTNGDQTVVVERTDSAAGRSMVISVYDQGSLVDRLTLEGSADAPTVLRDASGVVIAQARTNDDGTVAILDENGVETRRLTVADLASLRAENDRG